MGGGLKHTVRSHTLLHRRHRVRATNSRWGGAESHSPNPQRHCTCSLCATRTPTRRRVPEAPAADVEVQMPEPMRWKYTPTPLGPREAGVVHQQNRCRPPASASQQGKDERKIMTNCNIKKGHTAQSPPPQKKYSNTVINVTKAGALVTSKIPL
jgi:hypothetical protein